jgi:glyoxylase-like metal-dependent hydrolase (beta-lactamase superfamily II)
MYMLIMIAVLLGIAFFACMGLLRVLRELMDTKNSEECAPSSDFCAADEVPRATGSKTHNSLKFLLLAVCAAMAFAQAPLAQGRQALAIKVVTPAGDQFWTNSVIIEGTHEVMLVDAQLTKTNAEKVLQAVKATHKPLSIIYITHEHADHFLGLEVFKEAYPAARILANSNVVDRINKVYQEKIDKWKGLLGSDATSHVVAISKFDDDFIGFDNSRIEILKNVQGDTDANTMLWLPGQKTLIAGDVVFNDMHVYTAETDMTARKRWLASLQQIRDLKPAVVIPGHSKVGAPIDANSAVDFTEHYLLIFEDELKKAKTPDDLVKAMKEQFPSADLLLAIERGAQANVKP